ncbi:MAG: hypothetical protein Kow0027_31510 [Saprospiraceae bacterium]
MRIIHEYTQGSVRVTVFRMDNKFSVKLEQDLLEQTYKFREGRPVEALEDVLSLLDDRFFESAEYIFSKMIQLRQTALESLSGPDEDDFPTIL